MKGVIEMNNTQKYKLEIKIDEETRQLAKQIAKKKRRTVSAYINQAIVDLYVDTFSANINQSIVDLYEDTFKEDKNHAR